MINETIELVITQHVELYIAHPLQLESGSFLAPVTVAFETYGELNSDGTNAVLICHALTASAHAAGYQAFDDKSAGWWDGLIGPGKAFDTEKYFVVCPNILGSCYGTTGPSSTNPKTGQPYRLSFPQITVRDIVNVQKKLLDVLGVRRLVTVCGSSLGGMQVLEWGILYSEFCETIIPVSTAARQPAWCIALNAVARSAIKNDPQWQNGNYVEQPSRGLALARMIGMISYRSPEEFERRFGQQRKEPSGNPFDVDNIFQAESYLRYQGQKLVSRFDANTYLCLSHAMDLHDVTRGRGSVTDVLSSVSLPALCLGVSSDVRYPVIHQHELVRSLGNAEYAEIESLHGHDAFLIEYEQLNRLIKEFLERKINRDFTLE
ncbi:MAG: homoserine O-acetyltransferase [Ignavibacteriales bacterium]|nr:homoserine O-acetyltransferase [Ignavibacteriales bacterium]